MQVLLCAFEKAHGRVFEEIVNRAFCWRLMRTAVVFGVSLLLQGEHEALGGLLPIALPPLDAKVPDDAAESLQLGADPALTQNTALISSTFCGCWSVIYFLIAKKFSKVFKLVNFVQLGVYFNKSFLKKYVFSLMAI